MGLRERNAAATRESITDAAVALFVEHGYDATTMEQIARRAEVSASTLYRYFPTKDLLVLEPYAFRGQMATELRSRPSQEPLSVSLGHALAALIATPRTDAERLRRLAEVLNSTPVLRARALELFDAERLLLQEAVAERTGRREDDVFCVLTARIATTVLELVGQAGEGVRAPDNESAVAEAIAALRHLLAELEAEPPVFPGLPLRAES